MADKNNNKEEGKQEFPVLPPDPTLVRNAMGGIDKKGDLSHLGNSEIALSEITFIRCFSRGKFGEVWEGECRGSKVAIKKLFKRDLRIKQLEEFRREVDIYTRKQHPHICCFMGAHTTDETSMLLIMELLEPVSVGDLLEKQVAIPMVRRIYMCRDAADGMAYLHGGELQVLHRDLKPHNLLIDKDWNVKVTDFGLSHVKLRTERLQDQRGPPGTPIYMSPQVLNAEEIDFKIDVYAFGLMMWEIITGMELFPGVTSYSEFKKMILRGERPPLTNTNIHGEFVHSRLQQLMQLCWAHAPEKRPTFPQIKRELEDIVTEYCIRDKEAFRFWKSLANTYTTQVPVEKFLDHWSNELDSDLKRKAFVLFFAVPDEIDNQKMVVHLADFGNSITWFGPFDFEFPKRVLSLLSQDYFHGYISESEATNTLTTFHDRAFLVRASKTRTDAPFTISYHSQDEAQIVTHVRVYRHRGRYRLTIPKTDIVITSENDNLVTFMDTVRKKLNLAEPATGGKWLALFKDIKSGGYTNQTGTDNNTDNNNNNQE